VIGAIVFVLAVGLVIAACAPAPPSAADVERAKQIVWSTYNMPPAQMPAVQILTQPTCTDQYGNTGLNVNGVCDLGWTDDNGCHVLVEGKLSNSALAHEMHHWCIYMRSGGGRASMDPNHQDPTWSWEPAAAVQALVEAGL
jgi:hypothetical protein